MLPRPSPGEWQPAGPRQTSIGQGWAEHAEQGDTKQDLPPCMGYLMVVLEKGFEQHVEETGHAEREGHDPAQLRQHPSQAGFSRVKGGQFH